jgi:2-methylcitrate dehydratase PrpD
MADGAMSKRYHAGRASETGVVAACLASAGFTGPSHVLDARWGGFLALYGDEDIRPDRILAGIGSEFKILSSGIKPHACCRGAHGVVDAVLELRRQVDLQPDDVARIAVRCTKDDARLLGDAVPITRAAAQLSLPFCLSVALVAGRASLSEFEEPWLSDPTVRSLMARVDIRPDPWLEAGMPPSLLIERRTGNALHRQVGSGRGGPDQPLSDEEVVAKYRGLASRALPAPAVEDVLDAVMTIEQPDAPSRLFAGLSRAVREERR